MTVFGYDQSSSCLPDHATPSLFLEPLADELLSEAAL
jgi:hypothetical protein